MFSDPGSTPNDTQTRETARPQRRTQCSAPAKIEEHHVLDYNKSFQMCSSVLFDTRATDKSFVTKFASFPIAALIIAHHLTHAQPQHHPQYPSSSQESSSHSLCHDSDPCRLVGALSESLVC